MLNKKQFGVRWGNLDEKLGFVEIFSIRDISKLGLNAPNLGFDLGFHTLKLVEKISHQFWGNFSQATKVIKAISF